MSDLEKYVSKFSKENLAKINAELKSGRNNIIQSFTDFVISEYGVDPLAATSLIKDKIKELSKTIKPKKRKKKKQ